MNKDIQYKFLNIMKKHLKITNNGFSGEDMISGVFNCAESMAKFVEGNYDKRESK